MKGGWQEAIAHQGDRTDRYGDWLTDPEGRLTDLEGVSKIRRRVGRLVKGEGRQI
jgi:hypothetical protein